MMKDNNETEKVFNSFIQNKKYLAIANKTQSSKSAFTSPENKTAFAAQPHENKTSLAEPAKNASALAAPAKN